MARQVGGDPSREAGYNTDAAIAHLVNSPKHLANLVLRDIQQDSARGGR